MSVLCKFAGHLSMPVILSVATSCIAPPSQSKSNEGGDGVRFVEVDPVTDSTDLLFCAVSDGSVADVRKLLSTNTFDSAALESAFFTSLFVQHFQGTSGEHETYAQIVDTLRHSVARHISLSSLERRLCSRLEQLEYQSPRGPISVACVLEGGEYLIKIRAVKRVRPVMMMSLVPPSEEISLALSAVFGTEAESVDVLRDNGEETNRTNSPSARGSSQSTSR